MIRKEGQRYILYSADGSKKLGNHPTRGAAKRQEMAINISKAREAGHRIPKK